MSEAFGEALESEAYESSGEAYEAAGEAFYEGEGAGEALYGGEGAGEGGYEAYGEDARSDARRRARQRQIMIARQRQAQLRRRTAAGPPPRRAAAAGPSPTLRAIRPDVRTVDLDTQAALIRLRRALDQSTRMAYRNAWVAELSTGASQILDSFGDNLAPHDWARALIRGLPDLALAPGNPGDKRGLERVAFDPRFGGSVLIAAIWAIGHFRGGRSSGAVQGIVLSNERVKIAAPVPAAAAAAAVAGGTVTLFASAVDQQGKSVASATNNITWTPQDTTVVTVPPGTTGPSAVVTAVGKASQQTFIRVATDGIAKNVSVKLK